MDFFNRHACLRVIDERSDLSVRRIQRTAYWRSGMWNSGRILPFRGIPRSDVALVRCVTYIFRRQRCQWFARKYASCSKKIFKTLT